LLRLPAGEDNAAMKRRFQFSLRSLLIVVARLVVVCGDVGRQAEIMREPTRSVERLITTD
jgi:hypothetical protein